MMCTLFINLIFSYDFRDSVSWFYLQVDIMPYKLSLVLYIFDLFYRITYVALPQIQNLLQYLIISLN